jgi:hypothetical protein
MDTNNTDSVDTLSTHSSDDADLYSDFIHGMRALRKLPVLHLQIKSQLPQLLAAQLTQPQSTPAQQGPAPTAVEASSSLLNIDTGEDEVNNNEAAADKQTDKPPPERKHQEPANETSIPLRILCCHNAGHTGDCVWIFQVDHTRGDVRGLLGNEIHLPCQRQRLFNTGLLPVLVENDEAAADKETDKPPPERVQGLESRRVNNDEAAADNETDKPPPKRKQNTVEPGVARSAAKRKRTELDDVSTNPPAQAPVEPGVPVARSAAKRKRTELDVSTNPPAQEPANETSILCASIVAIHNTLARCIWPEEEVMVSREDRLVLSYYIRRGALYIDSSQGFNSLGVTLLGKTAYGLTSL